MNRFTRWMPAGALASTILAAALPALAQTGDGDADKAPDAQDKPAAQASPQLPGVVLERNVFVPVDASGKPASNQFIVVERRVLTKDGDAGASGEGAHSGDGVPTRFILVPQDSSGDADEDGGGPSQAPQQ